MKKRMCLAMLVLLFATVWAQAETMRIQGASSVYDCAVGALYDDKDPWGVDTLWMKEYWNNNYAGFGAYDYHAFIRVDLSALPSNAVINSATFGIKLNEADNPSSETLTMDLWAVSPFTEDMTAHTYDGVNPWPDGPFDGVDGYYRTPMEKLLASTSVNSDMNGTYLQFSDPMIPILADYVQGQSNLAAGEQYAYFELSWNHPSATYWCALYSTENAASDQPYLDLSYSVPEPASLSLLGIGLVALLRRKR